MFSDIPKHVRWFSAGAISFIGYGFMRYQTTVRGADPVFDQVAVLFLFLGIVGAVLGVIFWVFVPGHSRTSDRTTVGEAGSFWRVLRVLGGIAAVITIITALRQCGG